MARTLSWLPGRRHAPQGQPVEAHPRRSRRHRSARFRLEKLAELDRLRDHGTITEERYQQWKANLLR